MKLLEANIAASGFFREEKIPELIANLRGDYKKVQSVSSLSIIGINMTNIKDT
jgi:hypothetical protein